jgi:hypothetical protein
MITHVNIFIFFNSLHIKLYNTAYLFQSPAIYHLLLMTESNNTTNYPVRGDLAVKELPPPPKHTPTIPVGKVLPVIIISSNSRFLTCDGMLSKIICSSSRWDPAFAIVDLHPFECRAIDNVSPHLGTSAWPRTG